MIPSKVAEAFHVQARACENLDSPFMGQLMRLCATRTWPEGPIRDRIFAWEGEIGPAAQSVPLRLAGALHALHLTGHAQLATVYPPERANDDELWAAICDVMTTEVNHLNLWLDSVPQTNEVRRSVTLIPIGHVLTERFGLPIRTSELGASGGLNLHWHSYALALEGELYGPAGPVLTLTPEWDGPLPPQSTPQITRRGGVDLNPLNPADPDDALRLQAYLWPDQPHRLALTRAAIAAAKTPVTKGDAIDWLEGRLDHQDGETHLIYSTVAWQYFPRAAQERGRKMIEAAGEHATDRSPLAWFGMENDGSGKGAALTLRVWPGNLTLDFGRADFHGRWVNWTGGQAV
ncbi:DUF2332 domain-containing protein [Yoonia litorea]|uniref:DUF2332 domain-containing protein n=1 Tax=Yoonia litorea TaxID=1123755 RepID=A0A1I6LF33_9RHOB|nr:DUF2332 family protein [Yoonia litorea]SFS02062.1 hypothetical protein SAMN05444714_0482 [Yoonia litorea]